MEPGSNLEEAADAAVELDRPLGRLGDAREELEQRALAGAVAADEPEDLALPDLEGDVAQRPQSLVAVRRRSGVADAGDGPLDRGSDHIT